MSARNHDRLAKFADHVLTTVVETQAVKVYKAHKPGTRINSFELAFTPEAICLSGDYCPGTHGVVARGRSPDWFCSATGDYLCEKFLAKGYYPDNAGDWLNGLAEDHPEEADALRELAARHFDDYAALRDAVEAVLPSHDWCDSSPWGYDPTEVMKLAVCQRVFARLWWSKR